MNTVFCLVIAVQLPFVGQQAPLAPLPQSVRDLEATTQSVVKRRVDLTGTVLLAAGPQAADASDDLVVQASFQKTENQKNINPGGAAQKGTKVSVPAARNNPRADASASRDANTDRAIDGSNDAGTNSGSQTSNGSPPPASLDPATRAAGNASAVLLASALAPPDEDKLEGRPLPLAEALGRNAANRQRLEIASLYWKLALASADYHWAVDELHQLALPANPGTVDPPLLSAARAAAHAKMLEAKAVAVSVQQELADAVGQPSSELPLVVEQPLVGAYRTHFETIFASRSAPGRSRAIDRGLPLWREAIDLRTAAVQAATSAVQAAEEAYGLKNATAETVIFAHRELSQQRRAFLSAVREYNAEIVEYASYVAGPNTSTTTIVSMLTRPKPIKLDDGAGTSALGGTREPTLADPNFDPDVRRASGALEIRDESWQADDAGQSDADARGETGSQTEPQTQLKEIDQGGRD